MNNILKNNQDYESEYYENIWVVKVNFKWKIQEILTLIPSSSNLVSHIFLEKNIDIDDYDEIIKNINFLLLEKWKENLFQNVEKNEKNKTIIKNSILINKIINSQKKLKIIEIQHYKLLKKLESIIDKIKFLNNHNLKLSLEWDFKTIIDEINKAISNEITEDIILKLTEQITILEGKIEEYNIYEKNCYIYENNKKEKILVTIKNNNISKCVYLDKQDKLVNNFQINNIKNFWITNKKKFEKFPKTQNSKNIILNALSNSFYLERNKNNKKSILMGNIDSNLNFLWEYKNKKWEIINFKVEKWIVIYWYHQNWNSINIQQKSAIQKFVNKKNYKKFNNLINNNKNLITIEDNKIKSYDIKKLLNDCELFEWWFNQSKDLKVKKEICDEFIREMKKYFNFSKLKHILHKVHPDKSKNIHEQELFTRISSIIITIMDFEKNYSSN